ncbi:MAG: hypothetical protein M3512_17020 [Bacteroidota bacterium]|nr:hypothetical protein [Bacteroidota bacterium]
MKIKFLFGIIFVLIALQPTVAQMGENFPLLTAETLSNKSLTIPTDTKGKLTLIGLAYSQKAEKTLQTWLNPIYNEFIEKPENPSLFDFSYDIHVYFIPMFVGANQAFAEPAKKKMVAQLDKELVPHVLIYKGELASYASSLHMDKEDIPYIFVLDEKGKIIYFTSGQFSANKLEKLIEKLDW